MTQHARLDLGPGVTEPVVLTISRPKVESSDIASVVSRLKVFLATRQDAWLYRGQMTLVVDGNNSDPRELVDIPEVRAILRQLKAECPYCALRGCSTTELVRPATVITPRATPTPARVAARVEARQGESSAPARQNCVFRIIVTGRFGNVTAEFGNVTGHFGDVTDGVFAPA